MPNIIKPRQLEILPCPLKDIRKFVEDNHYSHSVNGVKISYCFKILFDNKIVGLDEFREYTKSVEKAAYVDYSKPIEGLQTPDDYTLVIKLKKPWPQITYLLAHLPTAPIAKEAVDYYGKNIINHPIGTGPYKLKTWHRGSYIDLVRNPQFRRELYPSVGAAGDAGWLLAP